MRLGDGQHAEEEAVGGSPAAAPFLYFTDALDGEQDDLREERYYGGSLKQLHRKPRATCDARTAARALFLALAMGCVFWAARFLAFRPTTYVTAVFARPLIPNPLPVEHLVVPFPRRASPSEIHTQFEDRLAAIGSSPSTLPCVWRDGDDVKYAGLKRRGRYLFALNLWNNQVVFPSLARTLLSLASFLGEDNVHVSIFENGSTDNTTIAMAHFAAALTALGADHTIVSDQRRTDWSRVDRIAQLAIFRNIVLLPLNQSSLAGEFEEVVFINDVFACPRDALELLYQKHRQNAHAACATDWRATQSWIAWLGYRSVKLYDNWVSRSVTGDMLRSRLDVLAETRDGIMELFDQPGAEYSRERFQAGLPVPVYSCWNGMLVLPAAPFRGHNAPAVEFRSALNHANECAASECKTLAHDFWTLGLDRWIMVPNVHVTYEEEVYSHPSLLALSSQTHLPHSTPELIDWKSIPKPKSVVCYGWVRGFHIDLPFRRTRRPPSN